MISLNDVKQKCKGPMYLERKIYYFFSVRLVYYIKDYNVNPDHLTFLSFLLVLISSIVLSGISRINLFTGIVLILLLNISNILDSADGQLARTKNSFTKYGWLFDEISDYLKQAILIIGIMLYLMNKISANGSIILCLSAVALLNLKNILREILQKNILVLFEKEKVVSYDNIYYKIFNVADKLCGIFKLGFLTVGEFYIIISAGIIFNCLQGAVLVLIFYSVFVMSFEFMRLKYGIRKLNYLTRENRQAIIFGAGAAGRRILKILKQTGFEPIYFTDNNKDIIGSIIEELEVISPDELKTKNIPVVISSDWYYDIENQLEKSGIENHTVIV